MPSFSANFMMVLEMLRRPFLRYTDNLRSCLWIHIFFERMVTGLQIIEKNYVTFLKKDFESSVLHKLTMSKDKRKYESNLLLFVTFSL